MDPEVQRARVRQICLAFPGASEDLRDPAGVHSAFVVNGKRFSYFLNNHHGDGVVGLTCKALPGVQAALLDMDRERFYPPAYMHQHGWIGMRLDIEPVDWSQAEQLLVEAYLASAPKKLAREFEAARSVK
jgi:predicted DNA-binding protein (MmcQ/YjbR family)